MFKLILSLLLLPACLFGASIPFSAANPNQLGVNPSTGQLWITNNPLITNITIFGSAARTNALFLGVTGLTVSNAVGSAVTTSGTLTLSGNAAGTMMTINTNQFVFTNGQFSMGISAPGPLNPIDIRVDTNTTRQIQIINSNTIAGANSLVGLLTGYDNNTKFFTLQYKDEFGANSSLITVGGSGIYRVGSGATNGAIYIAQNANGKHIFATGGTGFANERMRIAANGFMGINNTAPTEWLTVNGNGSFSTNVYVTNLTAAIGGLKVGPGTTITNIVSATAALDFGNILAAASADLTITVAGAKANDGVFLGLPVDPDASLVFNAFVSSANTVTVRAFNVGAIAVDQASKTFRVVVNQF